MRLNLGRSGRGSALVILAAMLVLSGVFVAITIEDKDLEETLATPPTTDYTINLNSMTISPANANVTFANNIVTFAAGANGSTYTITQNQPATTALTRDIVFQTGVTLSTVVLSNINLSQITSPSVRDSTITLQGTANVTLLLDGTNTVKAIQVSPTATVTIDSAAGTGMKSGSLITSATSNNAAIGGNSTAATLTYTINIKGGTITATASGNSAAIGGAGGHAGGIINISGGNVTATSTGTGAGIGGGGGSPGAGGGTITINGNAVVTVKMTTSNGGAAIGGGGSNVLNSAGGPAGTITIGGNAVVTADNRTSKYGAGIGGGGPTNQTGESGSGGSGGTIKLLDNAVVTASSQGGSAIGGGAGASSNNGAGTALTLEPGVTLKAWCWGIYTTSPKAIGATSITGGGYFVSVYANDPSGPGGYQIPQLFYTYPYSLRIYSDAGTGASMMTFPELGANNRPFAFQFPNATSSTTYTIYAEGVRVGTPIYTAKIVSSNSAYNNSPQIHTTNSKTGYDTYAYTGDPTGVPFLRIKFVQDLPIKLSSVNEFYLDIDKIAASPPEYIQTDSLHIMDTSVDGTYIGTIPPIPDYAILGYKWDSPPTNATDYTPVTPGQPSRTYLTGGVNDVIYFVYKVQPYVPTYDYILTSNNSTPGISLYSAYERLLDGTWRTVALDQTNVQLAVEAIKGDAAGHDCSITFWGDPATNPTDPGTLDIGSNVAITFDGGASGNDWGEITLHGAVTATSYPSTVELKNGVTIKNNANIKNTSAAANAAVQISVGSGSVNLDNRGGVINGASKGVLIQSDAVVHNGNGWINGSNGPGIEVSDGSVMIYNESGDNTILGSSPGNIEGTYGIYVGGGNGCIIENSGDISGTIAGVSVTGGMPSKIKNLNGGSIIGSTIGINLSCTGGAVVENSGTITGPTGIYSSPSTQALITNNAGATINGTTNGITADNTAIWPVTLTNNGTVNGNVVLGSGVNTVTFGAPTSKIVGNFDMSKSASGSTLYFKGNPDASYVYSTVTDITTIPATTAVSFDVPTGVDTTKVLVLIDGTPAGQVKPYSGLQSPYTITTRSVTPTVNGDNQLIAAAGNIVTLIITGNGSVNVTGTGVSGSPYVGPGTYQILVPFTTTSLTFSATAGTDNFVSFTKTPSGGSAGTPVNYSPMTYDVGNGDTITAAFANTHYDMTLTIVGNGNVSVTGFATPFVGPNTYTLAIPVASANSIKFTESHTSPNVFVSFKKTPAPGTTDSYSPVTYSILNGDTVTATFDPNANTTINMTLTIVGNGNVSVTGFATPFVGPNTYTLAIPVASANSIKFTESHTSPNVFVSFKKTPAPGTTDSYSPVTYSILNGDTVTATFDPNANTTINMTLTIVGNGNVSVTGFATPFVGPNTYTLAIPVANANGVTFTAVVVSDAFVSFKKTPAPGTTDAVTPKIYDISNGDTVTAMFSSDVYDITVNITGTGSVTVTGTGYSQTVSTTSTIAVPITAGYYLKFDASTTAPNVFVSFQQNSVTPISYSSPTYYTVAPNDTVYAVFNADSSVYYNITVDVSGPGSVAVSDGTTTIATVSVTSTVAIPVASGYSLTFKATAVSPAVFVSFKQNSGPVSSVSPTTYTVANGDTIYAVFNADSSVYYNMTLTIVGNGNVSVTGFATPFVGPNTYTLAIPVANANGVTFTAVVVSDAFVSFKKTPAPGTTDAVTPKIYDISNGDTVTAMFSSDVYDITVNITGTGSVTVTGTGYSQTVSTTSTIAVPITAGYYLKFDASTTAPNVFVSFQQNSVTPISYSSPTYYTVAPNDTVYAVFNADSSVYYNITVDVSGPGSVAVSDGTTTIATVSVTSTVAIPVASGYSLTFKATAVSPAVFVSFKQNSGPVSSVSPTTYTVANGDTIYAVFNADSSVYYNITVDVSGPGSVAVSDGTTTIATVSVTSTVAIPVASGYSLTFKATAVSPAVFVSFKQNSGPVSSVSPTTYTVANGDTIYAVFGDANDYYLVNVIFDPTISDGTVIVNGDGTIYGTLYNSGIVSIPKMHADGTTPMANIALTGADGATYSFVCFDITPVGGTAYDTSYASPTMVVADNLDVTATFMLTTDFVTEYNRINVDIQPDEAGSVTITGDDGTVYGTLYQDGYVNVPISVVKISVSAADGTIGTDAYTFEYFEESGAKSYANPTGYTAADMTVLAQFIKTTDYATKYHKINVDIQPDEAGSVTITGDDGTVYGTLYQDGYVNVPISVVKISVSAADGTIGTDAYTFEYFEESGAKSYANPTGYTAADMTVLAQFIKTTDYATKYNRVNITLTGPGGIDDGSGSTMVTDSNTDNVFGILYKSGYVNVPKITATVDLTALDPEGNTFTIDTLTQFEKFEVTSDPALPVSYANPFTTPLKNDIDVTVYFIDKSAYDSLYYRVDVGIEPDRAGTLKITGDDGVVYGILYRNGYVNVAQTVTNVTLFAEAKAVGMHFDKYCIGDPYYTNTNPLTIPITDLLVQGNSGTVTAYFAVTSKVYTITATADSGSTINPSGRVTVQAGDSKSFTFRANDGYIITEVIIDGVYSLSQAEIDSGSYTFPNVMSNHTIDVKSAFDTNTNDITLTINIKEGDGYEEYSINGGSFTRYTGPVTLHVGDNVVVRAFAADGYQFAKWETPSVVTTSQTTFSDVRASLNLDLYFTTGDTGVISGNVISWLIIGLLILVILLVLFLLWIRAGLFLTVMIGEESVKEAAITYGVVNDDGKTKNGVKSSNSRGKLRIPAKKNATVTISMAAKDGHIAAGLPMIVVMESRREQREMTLK
ncbi:beta strand repeat-containing protein [Candidatus Methanoplasma termitum]|nr:hypothetical protein [Candidatus Methanoplasma termitum]